jgi:asparagine synthase (glutamine-hydrolysing)
MPRNFADSLRLVARDDDSATLAYLLSWVRPREHAALLRHHDVLPAQRHFAKQWNHVFDKNAPALERLSAHATEVRTRLIMSNDYLPKVDIASMKESLEIRVPMLDEGLFEFGLTLPHRLKYADGRTKCVLRDVAARELPAGVVALPKRGFSVPVDRLLGTEVKSRMKETLLAPSSGLADYFEPRVYRPIVTAFCDDAELPGISRQGLYQRAIMLLAVHLALARSTDKPKDAVQTPLNANSRS